MHLFFNHHFWHGNGNEAFGSPLPGYFNFECDILLTISPKWVMNYFLSEQKCQMSDPQKITNQKCEGHKFKITKVSDKSTTWSVGKMAKEYILLHHRWRWLMGSYTFEVRQCGHLNPFHHSADIIYFDYSYIHKYKISRYEIVKTTPVFISKPL